jgi:NAD dependent epimerase/dehydratase
MSLRQTKVLVTGAGGFIGSHLVESLVRDGASVRAMIRYNSRNDWGNIDLLPEDVRDNVEVVGGDVRDPFWIRQAVRGCEVVFHLAALVAIPYSYAAPREFVETNAVGTLNVLEACLQEQVKRVIHTSTSEVYGTAQYTPIDENHVLRGQSPYSASKIAADKIVESYHCAFNLPISIIRPFNTFGPRQSARAVIPAIACQILSGKREVLIGELDAIRDLTYVRDTVEAFLQVAAADSTIGQVVNVGSGQGISIGDLFARIAELIGSEAKPVLDPQRLRPEKSEVMTLVCSSKKMKELTGWSPRFTLREGLQETISYIRENMGRFKPGIYNI